MLLLRHKKLAFWLSVALQLSVVRSQLLPADAPPRFPSRPLFVDQRQEEEDNDAAVFNMAASNKACNGLGLRTCPLGSLCVDERCTFFCAKYCAQSAICEVIQDFENLPDSDPVICKCPRGQEGDAINECRPSFIQPLINDVQQPSAEDIRDSLSGSQHSVNEFAMSMNDFTQEMLIELWVEDEDNLVFSPFSIHTVLSMLASGATGNSSTQSELLEAMGRFRSIQGLENRYKLLLNEYENSPVKNLLSFGNKMWLPGKYYEAVRGSFIETISATYLMDISILREENPEKEINAWVKAQTKGKIPIVVDTLPTNLAMLLVNAVYFKASWTLVFDPVPEPQAFHLTNGEITLTKMMNRISHDFVTASFAFDYPGLKRIRFTSVAIPYEFEDKRFEMWIVMPSRPRGLDFLIHTLKLNRDNPEVENLFDNIHTSLEAERGSRVQREVTMPEFSINSKLSMKKYLQRMGINAAFEKGNFDGIIQGQPLKVSEVKHRATIEVTPDGTVGAAASTAEIVSLIGLFEFPETVVIDKPFVFAIYDRVQRVFLFVGKYTNPNEQL